jgi:hypothetical protein
MPTANAVLITPMDLERAIERLPAEQRAQLCWAPERFRQVVGKLLGHEATPDLVDRVTVEFALVCLPFFRDVLAQLGPFDNVLKEVVPTLDEKLEKLKVYFRGSPVVEGVEWAFRALMLFFSNAQALSQSGLSAGEVTFTQQFDESKLKEELQSPVSGFLKAQVLLLALLQAAEFGMPAERMESLAESAYLEATRGVNLLATQGIELDPLKHLAPEQRFEKTLRYIEDLREILTPEDIEVISQARVTSL